MLVPLARSGYRVTGVDISPKMLARARDKIAQASIGERAQLIEADGRSLRIDTRFRLAFIALNSFMHFTSAESRNRVLDAVRDHLVPGGLIAFDVMNPHPEILVEADGRVVHDFTRPGPEDGSISTRFHSQRVDIARQILEINFFYDEQAADGTLRRTTAPFALSYFTRHELELLLDARGFVIENVYGSFDLEPYWTDSPKIIIVARKR